MTWAQKVKQRDNYTCVLCGAPGEHAHHIKPVSYFYESRNDVNNGITLCKSCHITVHRDGFIAAGHKISEQQAINQLISRSAGDEWTPISLDKCLLIQELVKWDVQNSNLALGFKNGELFEFDDVICIDDPPDHDATSNTIQTKEVSNMSDTTTKTNTTTTTSTTTTTTQQTPQYQSELIKRLRPYSYSISKAVKLGMAASKTDFIIRAVEEKLIKDWSLLPDPPQKDEDCPW